MEVINEELSKKGEPIITIDHPDFDLYLNSYKEIRLEQIFGKIEKEEPYEYYPICNYSIITMFNRNTHPSYIKAGIEICEDILRTPPKDKPSDNQFQKEQTKEMINFAENFLKKFKK